MDSIPAVVDDHPIKSAWAPIGSSVQLIIENFGIDGGLLLERNAYSRSKISGKVMATFGNAYRLIEGDTLRLAEKVTPQQHIAPFEDMRHSKVLPQLIYLIEDSPTQWFEVNRAFHVGPIRLLTALSILPPDETLSEFQLVLFDGTSSRATSEALSTALIGVSPLLESVIADAYFKDRQARFAQKVLTVAETDPLTGTLNRFGWEVAVQRRIKVSPGSHISVITFDLDNLKTINDTAGHPAGDEYIRRFAEVMSSSIREGDIFARIGGDEFVLLAPLMTIVNARDFANRIDTMMLQNGISVSIGCATGTSPLTLDRLMVEADNAMYHNKRYRKQVAASGLLF